MNGPRENNLPLEAGVGLRGPYFSDFASGTPRVGFLEIHPENYFGGGHRLACLQEAAKHYPLSFHCVGLSLGSVEPPKAEHLKHLARLCDRFKPSLVSDHLSWSASGNAHLNDLLPLPYTRESLSFVCRNIHAAQQALGRSIAIENPSTYLTFEENEFSEADFLNEVSARTGCGILLDVNNIYVSACNNNFDARTYLEDINENAVAEIHLSGHTVGGDATGQLRIDTHDRKVCDDVWELYDFALGLIGPRPTLIEWDAHFPPLARLLGEAKKAQILLNKHASCGAAHAVA